MSLEAFIGISRLAIDVFGGIFIVYGAVAAIVELFVRETHIRKKSYNDIRRVFTTRILISLEFFVASDVLKTIIEPTFDDLIILGSLVAIRTVMGYFLGKEVEELPVEGDG